MVSIANGELLASKNVKFFEFKEILRFFFEKLLRISFKILKSFSGILVFCVPYRDDNQLSFVYKLGMNTFFLEANLLVSFCAESINSIAV